MLYHPRRERCPLPHYPFKSCTVPRPIGWLSTVSRDGVVGEDEKLDIAKRQPIARMGYHDHVVVRETFNMHIPGATGG